MEAHVAVHSERLRQCVDRVLVNGFRDEDIGGDTLTDVEFESLDWSLFLFKERWRDDPIVAQASERGTPSTVVDFCVVDFCTADAILPFRRLERYKFTSRRLYVARTPSAAHFMAHDAIVDDDTRQLLARARITMRIRMVEYNGTSSQRSTLVLAPTNVVVGYVV